MSVTKLLLGLGGAAVLAAGAASMASAQSEVAAGVGPCKFYAREYAAVHVPQFGLLGWNIAYRHAYNACVAGGPSFIPEHPVYIDHRYGYTLRNPFAGSDAALAAPVAAGSE